jgi:hypothetical protein
MDLLERVNLSHWTTSPDDGMDKVQKTINPECHTPLSEPFRIFLGVTVVLVVIVGVQMNSSSKADMMKTDKILAYDTNLLENSKDIKGCPWHQRKEIKPTGQEMKAAGVKYSQEKQVSDDVINDFTQIQ